MIRPSNRVENIKEYYFSKKLREIAELRAQGVDIISLGVGGPDLPPPADVVETLCEAVHNPACHGYQPHVGISELRQGFADWYRRSYGVTLDPRTEIQPLIGSKEGVTHISLAFLNPGDKVLVPDPGYPTYTSISRMAGAEPVFYRRGRMATRFRLHRTYGPQQREADVAQLSPHAHRGLRKDGDLREGHRVRQEA